MGDSTVTLPRFYIRAESKNLNSIKIYPSSDIPRNRQVYHSGFHEITDGTILMVDRINDAVFPDIINTVYPMASEKIIDMLELYNIDIIYKRVGLIDRKHRKTLIYYLLYTDNLVSDDMDRDFQIVKDEDGDINFVISLDFAESLIRRDIQGIELIEVEGE